MKDIVNQISYSVLSSMSMLRVQSINYYTREKEKNTQNQEKKTIKTDPEIAQMLGLGNKDLK